MSDLNLQIIILVLNLINNGVLIYLGWPIKKHVEEIVKVVKKDEPPGNN